VAETVWGDELWGADRTILVEDTVVSVVKRVQKLSAVAKAGVGTPSDTRGGGGRRGGKTYGGRQQYNIQNFEYDPRVANGPPRFNRSNGPPSFLYGNGGGRGGGPGTCFTCGQSRHHAKQCPKASYACVFLFPPEYFESGSTHRSVITNDLLKEPSLRWLLLRQLSLAT